MFVYVSMFLFIVVFYSDRSSSLDITRSVCSSICDHNSKLTTTIFIWCCAVRNKLNKSKQNTPQLPVVDNSRASDHQQSVNLDQSQQYNQKSEHIYSLPRWSRDSSSSMLYNQAYQERFVLTVNTVYSSSTE